MIHSFALLQAGDNLGLFIETIRWDERRHRFADNLVSGVAEEPLRAFVPACDDAVQIFANDGVVGRIDDGSKKAANALGVVVFGDVAGDFGCADNLALIVSDRRNGQRDIEQGGVLPLADGLEMIYAFAPRQAGDNLGLFIETIGWDEHR